MVLNCRTPRRIVSLFSQHALTFILVACMSAMVFTYVWYRHHCRERLISEIRAAGGEYAIGSSIVDRVTARIGGGDGKYSSANLEGIAFDTEWMRARDYLSSLPIEDLWVNDTAMSSADVARLLKAHPLVSLYAKESSFADSGAIALHCTTSLRHLSVGNTALTDVGLAALPLKQLVSLHIEHTSVTPGGIAELRQCSNLEELGIDGRQLDGRVVEVLQGLPRLQIVDLWGNDASDGELMMLAGIAQIRNIVLHDTAITDDGGSAFNAINPMCEITQE